MHVQPQHPVSAVPADKKQMFAVTVESAFIRGLKAPQNPQLKEKLRAVGIDVGEKLKPSYPYETYLKGLRTAADVCFPGMPRDAAYRKIGEASARAFGDTVLGKLLVGACRLMGPHRVLEKAQTQFRTMSNFLVCNTKQLGPTRYEMWISDAGERATYFEGVVGVFLEYAGAKDFKMRIVRREGDAATYDLVWADTTKS